jgi:outer membrane protein assembly factor BamD (BamD/ComL family)
MDVNTPAQTWKRLGMGAGRWRTWSLSLRLVAGAVLSSVCASGCVMDSFTTLGKPNLPPPPAESATLRADGLTPEKPPEPGSPQAELVGARVLFKQGQYSKAETLYHRIGDNPKNQAAMVQEAKYYEAECLRLQGRYPRAADQYMDLLKNFHNTQYREQAIQHMFDIANYWLDDTRVEMKEMAEKRKGDRWIVWPHFIHFETSKPLLDEEGRAFQTLEQVHYNDIDGPLGEQALFMLGSVKFFNGDYRDADLYFSQVAEKYRYGKLAPKAVELAIMSKHLSTGGAEYDGRKCAEARKLVETARASYPELAHNPEKQKFLQEQVAGITTQQAEKDFKMAEFWRRTGHPGAAYFYYEMVCRRYPDTEYAKLAAKRIVEIKDKVEKEDPGQTGSSGFMSVLPRPLVSIFQSDAPPPPRQPVQPGQTAPQQAPQGVPVGPVPPGNPEVAPAPRAL